jgi:hypothetical protein
MIVRGDSVKMVSGHPRDVNGGPELELDRDSRRQICMVAKYCCIVRQAGKVEVARHWYDWQVDNIHLEAGPKLQEDCNRNWFVVYSTKSIRFFFTPSPCVYR